MPRKAMLLTGRFGKWTVLGFAFRTEHSQYYYRCRCDCGTESDIRGAALTSGKSQGCLKCNTSHVTHGHSRGGALTPEYRTWHSLRARCCNPKDKAFPNYGGRGITICERWQGPEGFANFLADMGTRPNGMTLERIDNNGPYSPENCRWATYQEQGRNKRNNRNVKCGARTLCASEWARVLGVDYRSLHHFLTSGWTLRKTRTGYALCSPAIG